MKQRDSNDILARAFLSIGMQFSVSKCFAFYRREREGGEKRGWREGERERERERMRERERERERERFDTKTMNDVYYPLPNKKKKKVSLP